MIDTLIAGILALLVSVVAGKICIPVLHRLKVGQTVRNEGPESHLKKNGTPTMGGVIFLLGMTVASLVFAPKYPYTLPVLLMTLGFGLVGFLDDFIKVVLKRSMGLTPLQKMAGQFLICGVFAWYMVKKSGISMDMLIPFTSGKTVSLGIFAVPFLFLVVLGTVNGTNFTDGLDGLASNVTIVVAVFLTACAFKQGLGINTVTAAMMGGLLGFLFYNTFPASVFMGDTGSLALGGFVASCAYLLQMPLFILLFGFIYLIEVISVILQVGYFKISHGKRIFKMAPIHHHFEKCGYKETKVVAAFTIVTVFACAIAYLAI